MLLSGRYNVSRSWLPLLPGLRLLGRSYNVSWGQLPLMWYLKAFESDCVSAKAWHCWCGESGATGRDSSWRNRFGKRLGRIGVNSFLNVWYNSPVRPCGPGLFFTERSLLTDLISWLVIDLCRVSIYSWFSIVRLYVCKNFSISSRLSSSLEYNCL